MDEVKDEGWGWPENSKKAHFFRKGTSLCNRWFFLGSLLESSDQVDEHPSNCSTCQKKRLSEVAKKGIKP